MTAADIPAAVRRFRDAHPRVDVSLRTGGSEELATQIAAAAIDVAFLGLPPAVEPAGVRSRRLGRGELVAVLAPDHPLADVDRTDLAALADHPFVDFSAGTPGRLQSDVAFAAAGVTRHVAFEVTTGDLAGRLVSEGLGVAFLPAAYAATLPGVRTVPVDDAPVRDEYVAWSRHRPTPAAAAFLTQLDLEIPQPPGP
ncbi:LysR substrate-binding domain-containing protein [Mumia flava]|uniref:LysR substrate-binding domain-containing protein n=1 Tax=Mumia flava TaxID=1348852 RepID=UPI001FE83003|nr:LysR substrate-binding domain-containing protein [Mumia flava]